VHAHYTDAGANQTSYPYKMKITDMTQRYRKFKRAWGMWYAFDTATGNSVSLKTRVKTEAIQKVNAMNETERQPGISLGLARVYLNATDPKLATRTWQDVMDDIVTKKADETLRRWETAIKNPNFDFIRRLRVAETRPEHFDRASLLSGCWMQRAADVAVRSSEKIGRLRKRRGLTRGFPPAVAFEIKLPPRLRAW